MRVRRRGGTLILVLTSVVALCGVTALTVDAGRLYMEKQAAQNTADAGALAGGRDLPHLDQAQLAAQRTVSANGFSSPTITFLPAGSTKPLQIRVRCTRTVPLLFGAFVGMSQGTVAAEASVSRTRPANQLVGGVPWGVLPDNYVLGQVQTLKMGSQSDRVVPGNFQALDLDGSGAADYSNWLKWGFDQKLSVGQTVLSETGNMVGPTNQAIKMDMDSRFERAKLAPWNDDAWGNFDAGNPSIVTIPIIDWYGATKDGKAEVTILGFAAFYVNDFSGQSITGSFVEYTDGNLASVDPTLDEAFDGKLYSSRMDG